MGDTRETAGSGGRGTGGHIVLRVVSVIAVGTVAAALLVGFFFGGDFGAAMRWVTDAPRPQGESRMNTASVRTSGDARLDGSCKDPKIKEKVEKAALDAARREADDTCRALPGIADDARLALRRDEIVAAVVTEGGGRCQARAEAVWTCMVAE
jgi:hypothetical protein